MKRDVLDRLRAARRERRSVALVTELGTGVQRLAEAGAGRTRVEPAGNDEVFTHVFQPTPRLILVGAVHIAQKLVPIARLAGFAVDVVDPRIAFATTERFPDVGLAHDWPDKAVAALSPDSATAVVTLTHDPKLDDPGLIVALRSRAFYVGALGSRKTHGRRIERLTAEGFDDAALARIRAPVGLPIGAISPGEIAVSIMADIIAVRHGRALQAAAA
ncbi:MAG: putative xanthine and dehydrogenase maturation factor, XdhC/CoxI family protein [Rhodospirillales bacterium]|nr:putative xanthine and dehydrogenase maturation factor, XdhC/CoxI family protein [Rhodospirillales bacterium]